MPLNSGARRWMNALARRPSAAPGPLHAQVLPPRRGVVRQLRHAALYAMRPCSSTRARSAGLGEGQVLLASRMPMPPAFSARMVRHLLHR